MPKPVGTVVINCYVSPELKAAFAAKCKADGRKQGWVLEHLITEWLAADAASAKPAKGKGGK